jgi:hypothetical protein
VHGSQRGSCHRHDARVRRDLTSCPSPGQCTSALRAATSANFSRRSGPLAVGLSRAASCRPGPVRGRVIAYRANTRRNRGFRIILRTADGGRRRT